MKDHLLKYVRFNLWANTRFVDFLNELPAEQLDAEIVSSFPSLKKTVYHIWGGQWIWLIRLNGESPASMPNKDFEGSFKETTTQLLDISQQLINFTEATDEASLNSICEYKTLIGEP